MAANGSNGGPHGIDLLKRLLKAIEETDVTEITYEEGEVKISLRRGLGATAPLLTNYALPAPPHTHALPPKMEKTEKHETPAPPAPDHKTGGKYRAVCCPFVGTFYRAPAPNAPPFIQVGQEVHPGDVLCIVEAMKLMNEIECETHARISQICVENGAPVEFGQELIILELLA